MLFAENDEIISTEGAMDTIERIKRRRNKNNFTVKVIKNAGPQLGTGCM